MQKGFELHVNGEKVYTVALGPRCTVSIRAAGWEEGGYTVHAQGVNRGSGEKFCWPIVPIQTGDEIILRFVETDDADPPEKRYPPAPGWRPSPAPSEP